MKKYYFILLFLSILFCFPLFVQAKDSVKIVEAMMEEKSKFAVELEPVSYEDLNLSFNVSFAYVTDYVRYKVTVQNDTTEDYKIENKDNAFQKSDYILYQIQFDQDDNIIEANSTKTFYVTARYMKELDSSHFVNNKYLEDNHLDFNLSNEKVQTNPQTGFPRSLFIFIGVVALIGISVSFSNTRFLKRVYGVFVLGILLLPLIAYAIEVLTIQVNSKVEISGVREFCYDDEYANPRVTYHEFVIGTTMSDYLAEHEGYPMTKFVYNEGQISKTSLNEKFSLLTNGEYTDLADVVGDKNFADNYQTTDPNFKTNYNNLKELYLYNSTHIFMNSAILDKSVGCYAMEYK